MFNLFHYTNQQDKKCVNIAINNYYVSLTRIYREWPFSCTQKRGLFENILCIHLQRYKYRLMITMQGRYCSFWLDKHFFGTCSKIYEISANFAIFVKISLEEPRPVVPMALLCSCWKYFCIFWTSESNSSFIFSLGVIVQKLWSFIKKN